MKTNKIADKDLKKVSFRWILGSQITWNYEKMMAPGYHYSILPVLRKLYSDDDLQVMMKSHMQFFNTTPHMGGFILGMDIAMEEEEGINGVDAVQGLKTGLMGPFAGIGDTIFGVLIPTITASIASYMALEGNWLGIIGWILINLAVIVFRYYSVNIGYTQGTKLVTQAKDRLDNFTHAATVLGITVVGALVATVVNANIVADFNMGEVSISGQEIFDQILPNLVPVLIVGITYYLLGRKNMTSTKAILSIMLFSIIAYIIGFLG
jgi:PTS system mannose-specific IID component